MVSSLRKGLQEAVLSGIFAASAGSSAKLAFDKDKQGWFVHWCETWVAEFGLRTEVCQVFEVWAV